MSHDLNIFSYCKTTNSFVFIVNLVPAELVCKIKMMQKIKYLLSKTNRWHRGFLIFLLVEMKVVPGGQLGFSCNDPALSHPFAGDTINWKLLLVTTVLLPLAIMLLVERKYHRDKKPKHQALHWYKEYLFGVLLNLVIIQSLKLLVGSPRPHFFDTCGPKEALTCQGSEYVSSYTCTKAHWLSQSDKSFPSGHTSLAVHTGLFLVYYLHRRACSSLKIRALQALFLATAVFCGVSRVMDRRHHWWDVLAGAAIAAPVLAYTIYTLCGNFECLNISIDDDTESNTKQTYDSTNDTPLIET